MDIREIARWLNRARLSAAPCSWLPAISIFVDEHYENFDFDLIGPAARLKIGRVLEEHGFHQRRGREFEGPGGRIVFPRATRSLASDPAAEFETVLDGGEAAVLATPTQVLLATWRRDGPEIGADRESDLLALVREQPANLDKIWDWLRRSESGPQFRKFQQRLAAAQEEGVTLRRSGKFRSGLPR